jgi:hypothetical protein
MFYLERKPSQVRVRFTDSRGATLELPAVHHEDLMNTGTEWIDVAWISDKDAEVVDLFIGPDAADCAGFTYMDGASDTGKFYDSDNSVLGFFEVLTRAG